MENNSLDIAIAKKEVSSYFKKHKFFSVYVSFPGYDFARKRLYYNIQNVESEFLLLKKVYDIDWSKLAVDTKILVSIDNKRWYKRYFAKFEDGKIYTFANGTTSFSYNYRELVPWNYAKLYEEEK